MHSKRLTTTLLAAGYLAVCLGVHALHVHPAGSGDCGGSCGPLVHHHGGVAHEHGPHEQGHFHPVHSHDDIHHHGHTHSHSHDHSHAPSDKQSVPHSHDDCAICQFLAIMVVPGAIDLPEISVAGATLGFLSFAPLVSSATASLPRPRGPPTLG